MVFCHITITYQYQNAFENKFLGFVELILVVMTIQNWYVKNLRFYVLSIVDVLKIPCEFRNYLTTQNTNRTAVLYCSV
jgi:hypothetical protein